MFLERGAWEFPARMRFSALYVPIRPKNHETRVKSSALIFLLELGGRETSLQPGLF